MTKKIICFISLALLIIPCNILAQQDQNATGLSTNFLTNNPPISVTIGGDFIVTGSYPAFVSERVDEFITRIYEQVQKQAIGNINDPAVVEKIYQKLNDFSLRDITLKRADGTVLKLDLLKFRTTGNFADDPYLKNDDVVIFPPYDIERNFFTISGAVNKPGKFLFVQGDKLSDAIILAQGINKAYENVNKAQISRLSYDGKTQTTITVNIDSDYILQRGDRIIIEAKETDRKAYSVLVVGEVNSPGEIPITKNNTTVKQVIDAAGGFKSDASVVRTRLFTGNAISMLLEKEYGIQIGSDSDLVTADLPKILIETQNLLMARMSNLTPDDTTYFAIENELRVINESGSIDFTKIQDTSSTDSKYIVHDNDVIIVPQQTHAVYVFGQVPNPGYVPYSNGKEFEYYINQAGGYGEFAKDKSDVMIIRGNTKSWISTDEDNVKVNEGDYIYVPKVPQRTFAYYLGLTGTILGIVGSLATLILLLIKL
jgi:protein involved in polysaccharide export with SLBB domain